MPFWMFWSATQASKPASTLKRWACLKAFCILMLAPILRHSMGLLRRIIGSSPPLPQLGFCLGGHGVVQVLALVFALDVVHGGGRLAMMHCHQNSRCCSLWLAQAERPKLRGAALSIAQLPIDSAQVRVHISQGSLQCVHVWRSGSLQTELIKKSSAGLLAAGCWQLAGC